MRELLHKFGYLSADGDGDRYISSGGMVSDELAVTAPATYGYSPRHLRLQVSDELGRLAQAYSVSEVELGELGAAG